MKNSTISNVISKIGLAFVVLLAVPAGIFIGLIVAVWTLFDRAASFFEKE